MRIILVEGSLAMQRILLERLQRVPGVVLCGSATGEDAAVEAIDRRRPDVVLLDISLAQGDGWGVLARARASGFTGRVLIVTHFGLPQYRQQARELGADGFYVKSEDLDVLVADLAEASDVPPQAAEKN